MDTSNMLNLENLDSADPSDVLRQRNHMRALRRQSVMRARRESSSGSDAMHHLQLPHGSSRRGSTTSTISSPSTTSSRHTAPAGAVLPPAPSPNATRTPTPSHTRNSPLPFCPKDSFRVARKTNHRSKLGTVRNAVLRSWRLVVSALQPAVLVLMLVLQNCSCTHRWKQSSSFLSEGQFPCSLKAHHLSSRPTNSVSTTEHRSTTDRRLQVTGGRRRRQRRRRQRE